MNGITANFPWEPLGKMIRIRRIEGIGDTEDTLHFFDRSNGKRKDIVFTYSHN